MIRVVIVIVSLIFLFVIACQKESPVSNRVKGTSVTLSFPSYFPATGMFDDEPLTLEGIALGKKLFYENRLSKDGSISCASCHQQVAAFGTYDHDLSHGIYNQHSNRNAPPLFNLAWQSYFGWDGQYRSISEIAAAHIRSKIDMAGNFSTISNILKSDPSYSSLFKNAFGSPDVNEERIGKSLQQFAGSIISASTKYDSVRQELAVFSQQEKAGYTLFKTHCNGCHAEPLFTDMSFRNNGLPPSLLNDIGRERITGKPEDRYRFRVPTLRNLFLSFPFMHDGRLVAFSQIYEHYAMVNQVNTPLIDPSLKNGIVLTADEQQALTAFLRTLTQFDFPERPEYR
jgi:cytochrome c peroxidase